MKIKEAKLFVPEDQPMVDLLGQRDEFLKLIEKEFNTEILVRGNEISIQGSREEVEKTTAVFKELLNILAQGRSLDTHAVEQVMDIMKEQGGIKPRDVFFDVILIHRGKAIGPKTSGQKRYVEAIRKSTITFVIGPAGTGKTYLAMAMAVQALKNRVVGRIILTKPAIEAGEKLGFLPGDIYEKVDPYFRPLYDALFDMLEPEDSRRYMEQGLIEVAPLAYMRGRTLNDSFIILDEAQNTTPEQMKMFLTRLGFGSKMVVTGDITQVDLPKSESSGLMVVEKILAGVDGVGFVNLTAKDVVRHKLVQKIVEAYKRYEERKKVISTRDSRVPN